MSKVTLYIYGQDAWLLVDCAIQRANFNMKSELFWNPGKVELDEVGAVTVSTIHHTDKDLLALVIEALDYFSDECRENPLSTYSEHAVDFVKSLILKNPIAGIDPKIAEKYSKKPYNPIQANAILMLKNKLKQIKEDYEAKQQSLKSQEMKEKDELENRFKSREVELKSDYLKQEFDILKQLDKLETC